jgi:hypothetical protein
MIHELRKKYNSEFTKEKYDSFLKDLDNEFDYKIDFRISETPVFIPHELKEDILHASDEIISQLQKKEFMEYSANAIPGDLKAPGEDEFPTFLAIDFAICKDQNGKLFPQLIELQGFASLYCYQELLNEKFHQHFHIPEFVTNYFNVEDHDSYIAKLKEVIIADSDPENVVLLEIEPANQKTYIDFLCTEKSLGIKTVCLSDVIRDGKSLFYENDGKRIRIERIYNRVIHDELQNRPYFKFNFSFQDELYVKWMAHPNWFFRISKHTLPYLKSSYVPKSFFLNDLYEYPDDLENYVLKPLFSFAGAGVKYEVTKEMLDGINDKENFILQKKVNYEPVIETPDDPAKAELRLLFVYDEKAKKPVLINNLVRLSKGKMMGVDFNKEKTWVGSSIAYFMK